MYIDTLICINITKKYLKKHAHLCIIRHNSTHTDKRREIKMPINGTLPARNCVRSYLQFFEGISDEEFQKMSRDEIIEMLHGIDSAVENLENK